MLNDIRVRQLLETRLEAKRRSSVEICKRVANIPIGKQLGLSLWWIRGRTMEREMGSAEGGVPGQNSDYPGRPTRINGHTGQGDLQGAECSPANEENDDWEQEDEKWLEEVMAINRDSGRWLPWNQCHSVVKEALDACRVPDERDAAVPVMGTGGHVDAGAQ